MQNKTEQNKANTNKMPSCLIVLQRPILLENLISSVPAVSLPGAIGHNMSRDCLIEEKIEVSLRMDQRYPSILWRPWMFFTNHHWKQWQWKSAKLVLFKKRMKTSSTGKRSYRKSDFHSLDTGHRYQLLKQRAHAQLYTDVDEHWDN